MSNIGKVFEESFKKSVPSYALLYRLPDSAQSFGGANNLRFSRKNPFDFLMWDSVEKILFSLELKTVKGKSISFERNKDESGTIHKHQIDGLSDWARYDGIVSGFIIEYRAIETTIFLGIDEFKKLISIIPKKSFTIYDLENNNIPYIIILQKKARTRYTYDIDHFICEIRKRRK